MFSFLKNKFDKKFNPKFIALAIITFYPKWYQGKLRSISNTDKIRGDLALEFLKIAHSEDYQIVVVDGHSSKSFRKQLNTITRIKIIKRKGYKRSPAKRQAYKTASKLPGIKVIVATEAEKLSVLNYIKQITLPIIENEADIIIPKREEQLFKETYPDYMYESEVEANKLYNEQLKLYRLLPQTNHELDLYFGPRVFRNTPQILALFMKKFLFEIDSKITPKEYFDVEESSNAQYFPVVLALKKGFKVKSVEIPFSYPKLQKENESIGNREYFEEKRKGQKMGILLELMHLLNYLKRK